MGFILFSAVKMTLVRTVSKLFYDVHILDFANNIINDLLMIVMPHRYTHKHTHTYMHMD